MRKQTSHRKTKKPNKKSNKSTKKPYKSTKKSTRQKPTKKASKKTTKATKKPTKKTCQIEKILLSILKNKLRSLSPNVQRDILHFIRSDSILPRMKIHPKEIKVRITKKMISVHMGARDFDFEVNGKWIGSGTFMAGIVWK
jgi:hypothetical protein